MAGDSVGSGETFDGGDVDQVPDAAEPAAAPEYADPAAEADGAAAEPAAENSSGDMSDFEPGEEDRPADPPVREAPTAPASGGQDQRDGGESELDDAAAKARETIEQEAVPAQDTQDQIDGTAHDSGAGGPAAPADTQHGGDSEVPGESVSPPGPVAPAETAGQGEGTGDGDTIPAPDGQAPAGDPADPEGGADGHDRQGAAEAAGQAAVDGEVEGPGIGDDEGEPVSDVDDVDKQISEHDRDLEANGNGVDPEVDLDELEELLKNIDLDTDLISSQHQWTEDDDSWEGSRDAARSGPMDDLGDLGDDLDPTGTGVPDNVSYPPFAPASSDAGMAHDGGVAAPVVLLNRDGPPAPEAEPADNFDDALLPATRDFDTGDTPGGAREYPQELVDYTDGLMGQGETGEEAAIAALERYELTGQLPPELMPQQAVPDTSPDDGAPADDQIPLFE